MKIYERDSDKTKLYIKTANVIYKDISIDKLLIFDIETTSFEAANGCIFLIGTAFLSGGRLKVRQFFSEDITEELLVIKSFLDMAENYEKVLSYKGENFDIPYISGRIEQIRKNGQIQNNIGPEFSEIFQKIQHLRIKSSDIFSFIKPIKAPLGFVSTKLNYLRKLMGQEFTEKISGENICHFYVKFLAENKINRLKAINCLSENVGLIPDYEPKTLSDDLAHLYPISNDSFLQDMLSSNQDNLEAVIYLCRLGLLFSVQKGDFSCFVNKQEENGEISSIVFNYDIGCIGKYTLKISLDVKDASLKLFFSNYRDYFYFPEEDSAVHKSVASFTSSDSRKKATPQTAYIKVKGSFLKIPSSFITFDKKAAENRYKENYESPDFYLPVNDLLHFDEDRLKKLSYYILLDHSKDNLDFIFL
ncbi:MAG: ribonuclease H-like domain-containing protein [Lachnospiraceae bacterium]|nr:ribonuclease H-like domain-containing protein [Lachnospiraceae bacterium]